MVDLDTLFQTCQAGHVIRWTVDDAEYILVRTKRGVGRSIFETRWTLLKNHNDRTPLSWLAQSNDASSLVAYSWLYAYQHPLFTRGGSDAST